MNYLFVFIILPHLLQQVGCVQNQMNIIILLSRVVFLRFLLWLLPLNLLLSPVDGSSDDYRLWCYRGLKYHIGQEVRQDNTECTSKFGFKPYCYRFVGEAALAPEVVKIGCATALCAVSLLLYALIGDVARNSGQKCLIFRRTNNKNLSSDNYR